MSRFSVLLFLLAWPGTGIRAYADPVGLVFTTAQSPFTPGVLNQGWYSRSMLDNDSNDNYLAAHTPELDFRNFFTFDLAGLTGTLRSATLQVQPH
jgi:hypothetical protein